MELRNSSLPEHGVSLYRALGPMLPGSSMFSSFSVDYLPLNQHFAILRGWDGWAPKLKDDDSAKAHTSVNLRYIICRSKMLTNQQDGEKTKITRARQACTSISLPLQHSLRKCSYILRLWMCQRQRQVSGKEDAHCLAFPTLCRAEGEPCFDAIFPGMTLTVFSQISI